MRRTTIRWWLAASIGLVTPVAAGAQTFQATPSTLGDIPDPSGGNPGARMVAIPVTLPPNVDIVDVRLSLTMTHSWVGDLTVELLSPFNNVPTPIFIRVGRTMNAGSGDSSDLDGTYVFHNTAPGDLWAAAAAANGTGIIPGGEYRATGAGSTGVPGPLAIPGGIAGQWAVRILDHFASDTGAITAASLTLTTEHRGPGVGPIPESPLCGQAGLPLDIPIDVSGLPGTLRHVAVNLDLAHTRVGDVTATLFAPNGDSHVLFSATGLTTPVGIGDTTSLDGLYTFSDTGVLNWWAWAASLPADGVMPAGTYRTSAPGTGAATVMNTAFAGRSPNGTWTLRVTDRCPVEGGTVRRVTLLLLANQAVDDSYAVAFGTPLGVPNPGVLANDITSTASLQVHEIVTQPAHGGLLAGAGGGFIYVPNANYVGPDLFTYRAATLGAVSNLATVHLTVGGPPMTSGADAYTTPYETLLTVPAPGVLANDTTAAGVLSAQLVSPPAHGTLALGANGGFTYTPAEDFAGTDSFTYRPRALGAPGPVATVTLVVPVPTTTQRPRRFDVVHKTGARTMLRWDPPVWGPPPTGYVLSGGVAPGQTLASIVLPADPPVLTIDLPPGVLYLRVATLTAAGLSVPSNELRVPVLVAEPPSAPRALTAVVDGSTLTLTWQDTFTGGETTPSKLIEVTGTLTGTVPITAGETMTMAGVPPGTYSVAVRGANTAGVGAPTAPIAVSVPAGCTGVPLAPHRFLAYRSGNTVGVLWEPPPTGPAPAAYVLVVSGAFNGTVPMGSERRMSTVVPPGSYSIAVRAANMCGAGTTTAPQVVVVP